LRHDAQRVDDGCTGFGAVRQLNAALLTFRFRRLRSRPQLPFAVGGSAPAVGQKQVLVAVRFGHPGR
jgi:hypothetical protein